jgi:hypothetical protein
MKISIIAFSFLLFFSSIVDGQDYWEIINTPSDIGIMAVEVNSNGDIFIGTGGGVYQSIDEGVNWEFSGIENQTIYSLEINELGYVYAGCNLYLSDHTIYRSTDNGQSWDGIYEGMYNVLCIKSFPGGLLFAASGTGSYISAVRSFDYGDTWEEVVIFPSNVEYIYDFAILNYDTIYLGTTNWISGGGVYGSVDGGENWEHIGLTDHFVSSLAINTSGDLFAGTRGHGYLGGGGVFVLQNGQTEWEQLIDGELVTSVVINSEDVIFIGCSTLDSYWGGVRRSADNGLTWEDISLESMYDRDIKYLALDPEEHLYAVEHNSPTPLYKSVNPTITSLPDFQTGKSVITYNYPNPFTDETTIYFSYPQNKQLEVKITIYSSCGKKIKETILPKYFGEEQSIKWNPKELPAGLYYYHISAGSIHTLNKMVLQK